MKNEKRILITGGRGYIAGRLIDYLSKIDHFQVNVATSNPNAIKNTFSNVKILKLDWNNSQSLDEVCKDINVLIHTAGMNAQDCQADPVKALEFNGVNSGKLIQASVKQEVKRFIYLSTFHIYSSRPEGIISEEKCPENLHPYATSHLAAEKILLKLHQDNKLEGLVIRLSNTFGAPINKEANCWMLLINDLCQQVVLKNQISIKSSKYQRRDFIPLEIVCQAFKHIIDMPSELIGNGIMNLGSGKSISIEEVVNRIVTIAKKDHNLEPEIVYQVKDDVDDAQNFTFSIEKLKKSGFSNNEIDKNIQEEISRLILFNKSGLK